MECAGGEGPGRNELMVEGACGGWAWRSGLVVERAGRKELMKDGAREKGDDEEGSMEDGAGGEESWWWKKMLVEGACRVMEGSWRVVEWWKKHGEW